jgi:heptosyltransferase-2
MTEEPKPKLLVVELWGLGDLVIATPFLQAAVRKYAVTVLAKPFARDLQARFWPEVEVAPFIAPWTAFLRKYRLLTWPWGEIFGLRRLAAKRFDIGLSARWGDPRDHLLLWGLRVKKRLGFPRLQSQIFLTDPQLRPPAISHRYEYWRVLGGALGIELPPQQKIPVPPLHGGQLLVHSGAGQPVRVWPLEHYRNLVNRLRQLGHSVRIACDPDQRDFWREAAEPDIIAPRTVTELLALMDQSAVFIGNDSGPAHLAALCGVPTFTLFGPQVPEWFAPLHPTGEWLEGKPCPYKPCSDYCRFPVACCMTNLPEEEVWSRLEGFLKRNRIEP